MIHVPLPEQVPVDPVYAIADAMALGALDPWRVAINVADGEPPMPAPWEPRMRLRGATRYVHPLREWFARVRRGWIH